MKYIVQISPTYPPNIGGVGHYAKLLADFLIKKKIKSKFFVSDFSNDGKNKKIKLFGKITSQLSKLLENNNTKIIVLHFSGYGYASRGLCFNLIKSIKEWKKKNKKHRLITIFHEIYATGPIYRMSFWTYLPQKYLAKTLFKLSDFVLTMNNENKSILSTFDKKKKVILSNVFSNIGEIKNNKKLNKRKEIAIIFGGRYQKKILYKDILLNQKKYLNLLNKLLIKKIIDIGPKTNVPKKIGCIPIKLLGVKSKKFISNLFINAKAGLIFYPVSQMTKSTIVASYASHGMLIINFCKEKIFKTNEFISGSHFISDIMIKNNLSYQKIANKIYKYYKINSISKTVSLISNFIKNSIL
jgi:hypothetical protein